MAIQTSVRAVKLKIQPNIELVTTVDNFDPFAVSGDDDDLYADY